MKAKLLNSRKVFLLIAVLCLALCVFSIMTFKTGAAELEGKSFAEKDYYKVTKHIAPDGPITLETEIWLPDAYHNARAGTIISNYNGGTYTGAYTFEVAAGGKIRVFSQEHGDVYIGYDITQHMGTDANPQYVKLAITVDTTKTADNIVLYVNGEKKATASNAKAIPTMYNTTQTVNGTTTSNLLCIGNDERTWTPIQNFKGKIKNVAMYKGVRDAATIAADHAATFYDTADANLLLAYDLTAAEDGFFRDLSANKNHANNKNWKPTEGTTFTQTTNIPYVDKHYTEAPFTYEALVYAPMGVADTGTIIANYPDANGDSFLFQVRGNGQPSIFITDQGSNRINYRFNYDIRRNTFVHLLITHETVGSDSVFKCYVDGELVDTYTLKGYVFTMDMNAFAKTRRVSIGQCGRPNLYWKGSIKNVAVHNRALSAEEIKNSYTNGVNATADNVIAYYDLTTQKDGFIEDKSGNGHHANYSGWKPTEGRTFTESEEPVYITKDLDKAPYTYEAVVYAPMNVDRPGVIIGNYPNNNGDSFQFEIKSGGKPGIYIYENGENKINYAFNYDVRRNTFVHVAITHETVGNDTVFKCYVDGNLVDTYTKAGYVFTMDMQKMKLTGPVSLGACVRTSLYWHGNMKNVALHSRALTAEEIKASYENGVLANKDSLITYYNTTGEQATADVVIDQSGNGYDMAHLFYEKDFTTENYEYSFAVVGDTQFMVYQDAVNGTNYTEYIYDWIVNNYSAKKMKYVFGLGDIIDNGKLADGTGSASVEWAYAKNLIVSKLGGNNIPYSVIGGNHDFMRPWDTGFNTNFKDELTLTKNITGYYSGTDVYNYYMNFEVEGTPYMLLALEYGANDDVLAWANEVVAQNSHRRVIVTTHGYMYSDGTTIDGGDYAAPKPTGTTNEHYLKYNNGDEMWNKFVRKHANITLVLSGHIDYNNIVMREDIGDHGNTVHQFLIDPQKMDRAYKFQTGMVAMLYFRNGGKDVSVEYVSTYRTANNEGKEVLFNRANQFDFTIKEAPKAENKGEINVWLIGGQSNATGYAEGLTAAQLGDSRYTKGFDNILYYGYGDKWQSSFAPVKLGYGNTANTSGAELGIAAALGNTGEMNAIIKYAQGATALYPVTDSWAATNFGTWTSPSYIAAKGVSTDGNKTGDMYINFINTVESAIAELRRMGYTPVIKGMWWMQGEEETYNGGADAYAELLTYFVGDVRADLTAIMGSDMSKMPFVIGQVYTEKRADLQDGINKVQEQQSIYVESDPYASIVSPKDCPEYDTQDQWHFNAATQSYLGKTFVEKANTINGEYIVEIVGTNVTATGGGLYKKGENVNITFNIRDTYKFETLSVKVGSSAEISIMEALDNMSYSFVCDDNTTFTALATSDAFVHTEYGDIPKDYESETSYPVALFMADKTFVGVYQNVTDAANKAMQNPAGHYVILLRNDVSQTNGTFITNLTGSITLDLGGFTLTKASSAYILEGYYSSGAFTGGKLTVKNGYMVNKGWSAFFCYNYGGGLTGNVTFSFDFDNVSFSSEFTAETGKNVIFETWDNGGATAAAITANVVFNDCVFDYTGSASGEIMLGFTCGHTRAIFNTTINGGKIISDRTIGIAELTNKDASDTVKFGKGANGYTVCALAGGAVITGEIFNAANGEVLKFSDGVVNGDYTEYQLVEIDTLATSYGRIDPAYSSVAAFPFAVFYKNNGSYVFDKGYNNYNNAMLRAIELTKADGTGITDEVILLLRSNFYNSSYPSNISDIGATVTIDLNGFTLTAQDSMGNTGTDDCGNNAKGIINIKNGKLLMKSWGIIFAAKGATYDASKPVKTLEYNLTNVYVGFAAGATAPGLLINDRNISGTKEALFNMNLVNCTLDMITNAPSAAIIGKFDLNAATCGRYNVTITGGSIIADKAAKLGFTVKASKDSVKFLPDENGKYTTVTLPTSAEIRTLPINASNVALVKGSVSGNNTVYTFVPSADEITAYGTIPAIYTNGDLYPFILFQGNKFYMGTSYFGRDNAESALSYGKANGTVILMRRNFTYKESQYNNLSQTHYITFDLGGYTFTSTDRIVFSAQKKTTNNTGLTVKNGTFVLGTQPLMKFSSWDPSTGGWAAYPGGNGFDFVFDNVNFVLAEGATTANVLTNNAFKTTDPDQFCNLTFNDCTFDLCGSANANVLLLDFSDALCKAKAVINGGKILTNGITFVNLNGANAESSLTFGKSAGKYTTVSLPVGSTFADMSNTYATVEEIECVFVKVSENEEYVNYSLYPKAMLGYKIKTSVTLWSNFVYNVYIPKTNVNSFTVNGATMEYEEVEIDGVAYYHVAVNLPAGETLQDIKVSVKLNSGATTVDANWTLNVLNYTKSVIGGNYDDTTKTLMKDMLVYANAAYTYFGNTLEAEKSATVATLLEGYTKEMPTGEAKQPTNDTYFTDVAVYLGEVPSFRFTLADGYTADNFTFKVGNRNATVIAGDGYVEIVMYAYMMLDDVTFTVNGTEVTESYNLYAYYEYAKTLNNANLTAIVEALMKYSVSAADYRNTVIGNNK